MKWDYDPLKLLRGAHTRVQMRNGQTLWIGVEEEYDKENVYRPSILILSKSDAEMWDQDYEDEWGCNEEGEYPEKSGLPIGPGGTEAFAIAGAALLEAERDIIPSGSLIVVGAATEKLFSIYEHFLGRRGYTRVAGEMIKEIS